MLLSTGRYGDCMVLLRSLFEDTDLMTYFACSSRGCGRVEGAIESGSRLVRRGVPARHPEIQDAAIFGRC